VSPADPELVEQTEEVAVVGPGSRGGSVSP
jgi:hypothetical protein